MVLYKATIRSRLTDRPDTKPWSNVFHVQAPSPALALGYCNNIVAAYLNVLKEYAEVFYQHVQFDNPLATPGASSQTIQTGLAPGDPATMLPLFNTVRVNMIDNAGRPNIKYFRFPLEEGDIENGVPTNAFIDNMNTEFIDLLPMISGLRSNRDEPFVSFQTTPLVQMRQQGWHRRTRPGFIRGWVPV